MAEVRVVNKTETTAQVSISYSPLTSRLNVHTYKESADTGSGWITLRPGEEAMVPVEYLDRPGGIFHTGNPAGAGLRVKDWEFLDAKRIDGNTIALVEKGKGVHRGRRPPGLEVRVRSHRREVL